MAFRRAYIRMKDCHFEGVSRDGDFPVRLYPELQVNMKGWLCLGPIYYGRPSWRKRLAWLILGHKVTVRPSDVMEGPFLQVSDASDIVEAYPFVDLVKP